MAKTAAETVVEKALEDVVTSVTFVNPIRLERQETAVALATHKDIVIEITPVGFLSVSWKGRSVLVPFSNIAFLTVGKA